MWQDTSPKSVTDIRLQNDCFWLQLVRILAWLAYNSTGMSTYMDKYALFRSVTLQWQPINKHKLIWGRVRVGGWLGWIQTQDQSPDHRAAFQRMCTPYAWCWRSICPKDSISTFLSPIVQVPTQHRHSVLITYLEREDMGGGGVDRVLHFKRQLRNKLLWSLN